MSWRTRLLAALSRRDRPGGAGPHPHPVAEHAARWARSWACRSISRYLARDGTACRHVRAGPGARPGGPPGLLARPATTATGRTSLRCCRGGAAGRSLLLTGHSDTVALGDNVWSQPPFGAEIHDGRLYGLGTIDMKGPLGAMLVLYRALAEHRIPLLGDLSFESVVDEEEGGVNATIAGRLRHGPMDGGRHPRRHRPEGLPGRTRRADHRLYLHQHQGHLARRGHQRRAERRCREADGPLPDARRRIERDPPRRTRCRPSTRAIPTRCRSR